MDWGVGFRARPQTPQDTMHAGPRDLRANTMYGGVRFDNINQNVGHDAAATWPLVAAVGDDDL